MNYNDVYEKWVSFPGLDEGLRKELFKIRSDEEEKKMRFSQELEFGTGGMRGKMGAGINNMNIYTVRRATCGIAKYIKEIGAQDKGVAIAYDSRHNSRLFALEAALTLAYEGVVAFLFDDMRATPEVSFAVRHLGCGAGVMVTASHNPKEYNGYKVYGEDGGQVIFEVADKITNYVESLDIFNDVKIMDREEAEKSGLIRYIGSEVDEAFYKKVLEQSINPECVPRAELKLVFTPFHGVGGAPVKEVLRRIGIKSLITVPEQEEPNGDFPTIKSPNPENPEGFALAVELAKKENGDIIIGTDPDCDRVGVMVRDNKGEYIHLTGNQTGALLVEYVLSQKKAKNMLPKNPVIIKTIVTNEIINKIAQSHGAEFIDVLTGFKHIAEKISGFEKTGEKNYVFGFEESYGYLPGTYVRDKDAVGASMLIAEMASWYSLRGMSLYDGLGEIYKKYGNYGEWVDNIYFEGADGSEKIENIMKKLRSDVPLEIGGSRVIGYCDVLEGVRFNVLEGTKESLDLPPSDVLRYETADGSFIAFRPSGTEPKFKVYSGFVAEKSDEKIQKIKEDIQKMIS